jgi:hypothetical protein
MAHKQLEAEEKEKTVDAEDLQKEEQHIEQQVLHIAKEEEQLHYFLYLYLYLYHALFKGGNAASC